MSDRHLETFCASGMISAVLLESSLASSIFFIYGTLTLTLMPGGYSIISYIMYQMRVSDYLVRILYTLA